MNYNLYLADYAVVDVVIVYFIVRLPQTLQRVDFWPKFRIRPTTRKRI